MAEALISVLLEQLASVVYQHTSEAVKLVLNADQDVQSFSSKLKAIQAVLEDAEKKQVVEARVADWLEKLKDVSYEMDDVLDEWNTELLRQQVKENALVNQKKVCFPMPSGCFCFGIVNKVIHHHNIATRIKELNEKLTSIAAEKEMFDFHQSTVGGHDEQLILRQQTSSMVNISMIYGREEERSNLLSKLLREGNQDGGRLLIIPIVGMGGLGKTTLAQLVYNDENVSTHFHKKAWVCVSEPFDKFKIARAIIESLGGSHTSCSELETLLQRIRSHVENKRFLLVLDDVWTENQTEWENLKLPEIMQSCAEGSTILVTTRKQGVAKMMRATSSMVHLDRLNDKDCLALFKSIAFSDWEEDESIGFGAIGEKIVKKCKGLPLAVKTLGSLLCCKKRIGEWQDVLNSKIWELEEVEEQVFRPLLLSYYDLAPAVKRCLLYCVTYPKDYELEPDNLIELWMSQDYLGSKGNREKRKIGQKYFDILAKRSFFQDFDKDSKGDVSTCKIHDIVHDFVQFLTKKECIILEGAEVGNERMELPGEKVRHLTLTSVHEDHQLSFLTSCKHMRSLMLFDSEISTINPNSILQMKCLRTLNLSRSKLQELPEEIGALIHLRFMDLSYNDDLKELPEAVCDLYNLQTLDLQCCDALEKLPKAMGKLINLKHLYVGGCISLRYLPKGIGNLKSLQVLDMLRLEGEDNEALKFGGLGMMDQLQGTLRIERLGNKDDASEMAKAQLKNKERLSGLEVSFRFEIREQRKGDEEIVKAIQPHPNLELLIIYNCDIGTNECFYWINSLHNLRVVHLSYWRFCQVLPPLGTLRSLEILTISQFMNVEKVGAEFLGREVEEEEVPAGILFPKLKQLSFDGMPSWEQWEGITKVCSEITIMPRLSKLYMRNCPKLKALPDFLYKITTLRTLKISDCPILKGEYQKGSGKEWHNISHIPNLTFHQTEQEDSDTN